MNRIDAALTAEVWQAMEDIFDTFAKTQPVRFYKTAAETITVFDPAYNGDFSEPTNDDITYTVQYEDFTCRIFYLDKQFYSSFLEGGTDTGIRSKQYYNRIKIQIKTAGFEYLKDTQKFIFWDEEYKVSEPWRRIGVLKEDQINQIILERIN